MEEKSKNKQVKNHNSLNFKDYVYLISHFKFGEKHKKELLAKKEEIRRKEKAEQDRLNALPKVYGVKMVRYTPKMKNYRGYEFDFMHKEKRYFYCVLIKEKEDYTERAYRNQAQFKFNSLLRSKSFDTYISNCVGLKK